MPATTRRKPARPAASPPGPLPEAHRRVHARFLTFLRVECGLSPNTLTAYGWDLTLLLTDLARAGASDLRAATPRHCSQHLMELKTRRDLAASSVTRHLATVKVFFRWASAQGLVEKDPTDILERPHRWQRLPDVLSPKQVTALIEAPSADDRPDMPPVWLRDRVLLELLYSSGLRASEAAGVEVNDVMDSLGVLRVTGK